MSAAGVAGAPGARLDAGAFSRVVSLWAGVDGRAIVWRRAEDGALLREERRFRPWLLASSLELVRHLGRRLVPEGGAREQGDVTVEELAGPGELRFWLRADDGRALAAEVLKGAARLYGRGFKHLRELPKSALFALPPEEQLLCEAGATSFDGLDFDALVRAQIDLETTGLDPEIDRVFLVAIGRPDGGAETLEVAPATDDDGRDRAEAELLRRVLARVAELDPDVIENHNLHGFDLPFLARRAELLGVPLTLGREPSIAIELRPAARGARLPPRAGGAEHPWRRRRFTAAGRELIDTLDAVRRIDFGARELPSHGLKAVARHWGVAREGRVVVPGGRVYETFLRDPERVRSYAEDDVREAAALARLTSGPAFELARLVPRRYERLADAGAATGVLDPLLVRAYLGARQALPAHRAGDGTEHQGAALRVFARGAAPRVVKVDVASLYPSLMRQYRIGPARDHLGALLAIVDALVERRLAAKAAAKAAPAGSAERRKAEAASSAMKLVVNSAYGYLAAPGLARFADVHAANEVTRRGRELLGLLCDELARRGTTLLEADTDGVYFSVPERWTEADERRVVGEVAALLPPLVTLELEGRYAAMLSHEPKNYALLPRGDGEIVLRGVAFRSSRAEPFGEAFLRGAVAALLRGDLRGVRARYVAAWSALAARALPTREVTSRVRLSKTPAEYRATRGQKRELPYEALIDAGREDWSVGERLLVYRGAGGRARLFAVVGLEADAPAHDRDARDYDVEHYQRTLALQFASRLATALTADDYATLLRDPRQASLFDAALPGPPEGLARLVLTRLDAAQKATGSA